LSWSGLSQDSLVRVSLKAKQNLCKEVRNAQTASLKHALAGMTLKCLAFSFFYTAWSFVSDPVPKDFDSCRENKLSTNALLSENSMRPLVLAALVLKIPVQWQKNPGLGLRLMIKRRDLNSDQKRNLFEVVIVDPFCLDCSLNYLNWFPIYSHL
jgi:transcriptional regulator of met regulon